MRISFGRQLSRRATLRGIGATIALPLLDAMIPASRAARAATESPRRFAAVYVAMGMNMEQWSPKTEGTLELTPILQPLSAFKDRLLVVGGLDNKPADVIDGGPHPRCQTSWLTGVAARRSETSVEAGISMDQIIAKGIGGDTQLPSLELAIEDVDFVGTCSNGYSCVYNNTVSWSGTKTPQPMVNNPRAVFERLFGTTDSTDAKTRRADLSAQRSILDSITQGVADLGRNLTPDDRGKVSDYLESIREVERRIQKAEAHVTDDQPALGKPIGIPGSYQDHVKLMFDLMALSFQSDVTRVGTYLMCREGSIRSYTEIGIAEAHHPLSHHAHSPERMAIQGKLNIYHTQLFGHFLQKLASIKDGDGSLLDHTLLLYGSGMSNSQLHMPLDLPVLLVGDKTSGIQPNRAVRHASGTPLTNLHVSLMQRMGVDAKAIGDSTGELTGL